MPPVKKNLKNGFNFYMDDYIPELRRQGIVIDHKQEAVPYLLADWKALRNVLHLFCFIEFLLFDFQIDSSDWGGKAFLIIGLVHLQRPIIITNVIS